MKLAAIRTVLAAVMAVLWPSVNANSAELVVRNFAIPSPGLATIEQSERDLPVVGRGYVRRRPA